MDSRPSIQPKWPSRWEWGIIVAFWVALALLSIGRGVFDPHDAQGGWARVPTVAMHVATEYIFWLVLTPLAFRLVELLPVERSTAARNVVLHVVIAFVVGVFVDSGEDLLRMALNPDNAEGIEFYRTLRGFWFMNEMVVYIVILLAGFARSYYYQKQERQREAERLEERTQTLEAKLTEARLEALRMQLNPHFLFNTLHAVSTLVDRDPAGVRRMIARLSELLRHVLDEEAPQEVPLSEELSFLDDYLEIQTIRFQGRLDVEIEVPSELRDAQVPNLILQPLVENAIKHGASQVRGIGRIEIQAEREAGRLVLSVRDNGPGPPSDLSEDGFGLRNVRARLRELYGDDQALHLTPASDGGTIATIELPYHTSTSLYTAAGEVSTLAAPSLEDSSSS